MISARFSTVSWKLGQVVAIVALMWVMLGGADTLPDPKLSTPLAFVVMPVLAVILVAFGMAVLVNISDWIGSLFSGPHPQLKGAAVWSVSTL